MDSINKGYQDAQQRRMNQQQIDMNQQIIELNRQKIEMMRRMNTNTRNEEAAKYDREQRYGQRSRSYRMLLRSRLASGDESAMAEMEKATPEEANAIKRLKAERAK